MRSRLPVLIALTMLAVSSLATAETIVLNGVAFPEKSTISLNLSPEAGAPQATMSAKVTYRDGQAKVDLSYAEMKPAILYGGDITCYVVWAVTRDGEVYNLGELLASKPKGSRQFTTAKKSFALMVTAEPISLVRQPSRYPTFKNDPVRTKSMMSEAFKFDNFRTLTPARDVDDIAELSWENDTPLELLQARTAHDLAGRLSAGELAPSFYNQATQALELANASYEANRKDRQVIDYSRRSVALSFEAVNITWTRAEAILVEKELQARRAEMEAIEREIRDARQEARRATQQKERLAALLRRSMSEVADTRDTAEGIVLSLPDILFDLNESTLKTDARIALAKLAGILLVMSDFQIRIEGHTDATGPADYNKKLSEKRAKAVLEFMVGEGIVDGRMSSVGYGIEKPIADNATAEGRKKNRRVEIVLTSG